MGLRPHDVKRLFIIGNIRSHFDSSDRGKCLPSPQFSTFDHLLSVFCVVASDLVTFLEGLIFTTLPFNWRSSKTKSSSCAASKTAQGWKSSKTLPNFFHFQLWLSSYFQACLRSISVQHPCHKSLHLHFSKRLKSLLYFHASLIVLLSIPDVERRDRLTVLKSNSHFQAGDKNYHPARSPTGVHVCLWKGGPKPNFWENWQAEGRRAARLFCRWWWKSVRCKL